MREAVGTLWSATMMLEHLGQKPAADRLMRPIEKVTADPSLHTPVALNIVWGVLQVPVGAAADVSSSIVSIRFLVSEAGVLDRLPADPAEARIDGRVIAVARLASQEAAWTKAHAGTSVSMRFTLLFLPFAAN